jgi:hypothetical protein
MRGRLAVAAGACVMTVATSGLAAAQSAVQSPLAVCLSLSQKVSISARGSAVILTESNAIWMPHGVGLRWAEHSDAGCDRQITVKGDQEALAEDGTRESALGWVPFVEGSARQLVFLRVGPARMLVDALSNGPRSKGLTDHLLAKLLGRILAHELGHILLNSGGHEESGLMRARYRASDVLGVPASAYTLSAVERARLLARIAGNRQE